jgi:hypothetical protein
MTELEILPIEIVPYGKDQWRSMGTEYERSFTAFKEIIDNSISASGESKCEILIKLEEQVDDSIKVTIEDTSGGVESADILLKISSSSEDKKGRHNIYGHGLKHALAFFNSDYNTSNWTIQSRTQDLFENEKILQVRAPYLYSHEINERYNHLGMNVGYVHEKHFLGEKHKPGTLIEFTTKRSVFGKMNPMESSGAPTTLIDTIAKKLSSLLSLYYSPILKKGLLDIEIKYCESDGKRRFKSTRVSVEEFPMLSLLGDRFSNKKVSLSNGGYMTVSSKWIQIDRNVSHPFVYAQKNGLLCYVNGILADPFTWVDQIFGGYENHPSMNSLICIVEVESDKKNSPELSVSKTKFRPNGENYLSLIQHLQSICPKDDISDFSKRNNTSSETVLRDRRLGMLKTSYESIGLTEFLKKEEPCLLPNRTKAGDNLRYDIIYKLKHNHTVVIEEFKKETIKPESVCQVIQYGELAKKQYENCIIELVLVSKKITPTAKTLIDMYSSLGWNIKFQSFADLHIPGN